MSGLSTGIAGSLWSPDGRFRRGRPRLDALTRVEPSSLASARGGFWQATRRQAFESCQSVGSHSQRNVMISDRNLLGIRG